MSSEDGNDPRADGGTEMEANDWQVDVDEGASDDQWQPPSDERTAGDPAGADETVDPYQPPESEVDPERAEGGPINPNVEIFSSGGVGIATLLGGPLAAVGLLSYNFHQVGWHDRVVPTIVLGLLACGAVFGLGFFLPTGTSGLGLGAMAAAVVLAKKFNGQIKERMPREPAEKSNWTAAGVGCLSLAGTFALFFVGGFVLALLGVV